MKSVRFFLTIMILSFLIPSPVLQAQQAKRIIQLHSPEAHLLVQELSDRGMDIARVDREGGTVDVVVSDHEYQELIFRTETPFTVTELTSPSMRALDSYTSPGEMEAFLLEIASTYPSIVELRVLSDSLYEGHKIYAVKISDHAVLDEDEPVFLMDCQHHAREVMTSEIARDAIEYLTSNYGTDVRVTEWIDNLEIWIVPMVNPDGIEYVFNNDIWWRKNRNPQCPVDLNRNYPATWNECRGSSGNCFDETFRGTGATSEPETQAMIALMDEIHPVFYLSYHSYGPYIIWPYGCASTPDYDSLRRIGALLNLQMEDDLGRTGHWPMGTSGEVLYLTDGASTDEPYTRYGTYGYTIEVNSTGSGMFHPDYATWRDKTVERQRNGWGFFLTYLLDGAWVTGHVLDGITGLPLDNATIEIDEMPRDPHQSARLTDFYGRYFFFPIPNASYHLTVSRAGYQSQTVEITMQNAPVLQDIELMPSLFEADLTLQSPHTRE
ncbi:MAG TPA: M14 family zinc carboxypeptidase [Thermoanaerobaculia bacterium]|nr:M14 family zinc carboxypeptidase [Thermoanaerobaculia bacterium]HUM28892.1 M14 family zinc carboxypeptidase [Thermoanaerobaculia bacterium]HXK67175.1 M14 family zinc carboxypeptidase [Thermoanaerobaculia bacterium]